MIISVRLSAFVLLALPATAGAQARPIALVRPSIVTVAREPLRLTDPSLDVVFVVRDANTPERSIETVWIALGPSGSDVRAHPSRTAMTRADGTARLDTIDSATVDVVVLRVGYEPVRFTMRLAPECRQTVEVYISQSFLSFDAPPRGPPTPCRVVVTTCGPPH